MSTYNTYTQNMVFSSQTSQTAVIATGLENLSVSLGGLFVSTAGGAFEDVATFTFYNNSDMADEHIVYIAQMQLAYNSLSASAVAGDGSIALTDSTGFSQYNKVQILTDGTHPTERRRIAVSGVSANTLNLIDTLVNDHDSGSVVMNIAEFGGMDLEDVSFTTGNLYVRVSFTSNVSLTLTVEVSGAEITGIAFPVTAPNGSSSAPSYSFSSSSSTGMYSSASNQLDLSANSIHAMNISSTGAINNLVSSQSPSYIVTGTGGNVTLDASTSSTTSYTIYLPATQGAAGTVPTNDGSGNLSWVAASGANTNLSNLTSPTAINQQLLGTNGSLSAPAYSFTSHTNYGLAQITDSGNQVIAMSYNGVAVGEFHTAAIGIVAGSASYIIGDGVTSGNSWLYIRRPTGAIGAGIVYGNPTVFFVEGMLFDEGTGLSTSYSIVSGASTYNHNGVSTNNYFHIDVSSKKVSIFGNLGMFQTAANSLSIGINGSLGGGTLAFNIPATQGAANTVLTNNGSGNLSWALPTTSFPLLAPDGSLSIPSYSFLNYPKAGLYVDHQGTNDDFVSIATTKHDGTSQLHFQVGNSAPGYAFAQTSITGDSTNAGAISFIRANIATSGGFAYSLYGNNTGSNYWLAGCPFNGNLGNGTNYAICRNTSNSANVGTAMMIDGSTLVTTFANPVRNANGTAAAVSFGFTASVGTGMYSSATNTLNLAANGTNALGISSTQQVSIASLGSNSAPSLVMGSATTSGWFANGNGNGFGWSFSQGGQVHLRIQDSQILCGVGATVNDDSGILIQQGNWTSGGTRGYIQFNDAQSGNRYWSLSVNHPATSNTGNMYLYVSAAGVSNNTAIAFDKTTARAAVATRSTNDAVGIGSALSTYGAVLGGCVKTNTSSVGNAAAAGDQNLMTYSVPASMLSNNNDSLEVEAWGTFAANANTKEIKLFFGATAIVDSTAIAYNGNKWSIKARIIRTGAATQLAHAEILTNDNSALANMLIYNQAAPAETLSGAITLKVTGASGASAASDIVQTGMVIKFLPASY